MSQRKVRNWLIFITLFIITASFLFHHFTSNAVVTTKEVFRPDEAQQFQRAIENFSHVIEENKLSYAARGAHAKGHGCVKAWFKVNDKLQTSLRSGVFSTPGATFKSWIRFSNGRSSIKNNHDATKDAHGMAIKVLLHTNDNNSFTSPVQDFLMHDHAVFFSKDIEDYNQFLESDNKILYFISDINPLNWHLREMRHGLNTLKHPPPSPLHAQYFSNTAYKLGEQNIKFSAKSCNAEDLDNAVSQDDPDFLRKTMQLQLNRQQGCFDFLVQLQDADKFMPIEDPSIEWNVEDSPYVSVANIVIPEQTFDTTEQQQFCENMSFSPWNGIAEHRPIGQLNRIRRQVYEASAHHRLKLNNEKKTTDLLW